MASRHFPLRGGLNLSASPLEVWPGAIRDSRNYFESTKGGYERIGGYERYDGRSSPAAATYYQLTFNNWDTHVTPISASTTITVDSTLTFYIMAIDTSTPDTLIAYATALVGTIADPYIALDWDGVSFLTKIIKRGSESDELDETYLESAWTYYRNQITQVGGTSTSCSGVLQINDTVLAFKNDATNNPKIYKATTTGWDEGRIGRAVEASTVSQDIVVNETIDSGNFTVMAVCKWYDPTTKLEDTTKKWLVVKPETALDFPAVGNNTSSGGATFIVDSVIQPINAFGTYIEYQNHNFLSHPDDLTAFIADGTNVPMAYSQQHHCLLPIAPDFNSLSDTKATHISVHNEKLMWSTGSGTFNISEPGLPFNYAGSFGAANIGVGDFITALQSADSENMIVYTKKGARKLTGTDNTNWAFFDAASNVGSQPRGVQKLDDIYALSSRGVGSLIRTDTSGGYAGGSVSTHVQEIVADLGTKLLCSTTLTTKEQIRWYFNDNTFLMMTVLPSDQGMTFSFGIANYKNRPVKNVSTEIWSDGRERTFFTSDNGYVYEADVGANFDGDSIYSYLELHSNHLRTPGHNKSFKKVFFEAEGLNQVTISLEYKSNYGAKVFEARNFQIEGGRYIWDEGLWDEARFDQAGRNRGRASLKGIGFSIGFTLDNDSKFVLPFKVTGYTIDFEVLGRARK